MRRAAYEKYGGMMPSKKKKKDKNPVTMSAAGLMSFYEDFDAVVKLGPVAVVAIAVIFAVAVLIVEMIAPM